MPLNFLRLILLALALVLALPIPAQAESTGGSGGEVATSEQQGPKVDETVARLVDEAGNRLVDFRALLLGGGHLAAAAARALGLCRDRQRQHEREREEDEAQEIQRHETRCDTATAGRRPQSGE